MTNVCLKKGTLPKFFKKNNVIPIFFCSKEDPISNPQLTVNHKQFTHLFFLFTPLRKIMSYLFFSTLKNHTPHAQVFFKFKTIYSQSSICFQLQK